MALQQLRIVPDRADAARAHAARVLARIGAAIEHAAGGGGGGAFPRFVEASLAAELGAAEAAAAGVDLPDAQLARRFGLEPLERELLWVIAAPHIDPTLRAMLRRGVEKLGDVIDGALCMHLLGADVEQRLALQALLRPGARLFASGLVRAVPRAGESSWLAYELVPAGHVVWFLSGVRALGVAALPYAEHVTPGLDADVIGVAAQERDALEVILRGAAERPVPEDAFYGAGGMELPRGAAVVLSGGPGTGRTLAVKAIAGSLGRELIVVDGAALKAAPAAAASEALEAVCQEGALYGEIVVIREARELMAPGAALAGALAGAIQRHGAAIVLVCDDDGPYDHRVEQVVLSRVHHVQRSPEVTESHAWLANLPAQCQLDARLDLDVFARQLQLSRGQMRKAAHLAYLTARATRDGLLIDEATLGAAARAQATTSMGNLAAVSDATLGLDDLILSEDQEAQIKAIIAAVKHKDLVLRRWGLRRTIKRGLGICALFDGDPGTGKTLSAEVIAGELGLKLVRINVAGIVDKYIGETEKNLTRIFEQARPDSTLLLFDEADSLFSKRTEVERSVDRYSNMDINVLLQLIEAFEGTAVLTTNLKRGMDVAFERRIMFKIKFERPDASQRERIWRVLLPPTVPTAERIDYVRLGALDLSGGEIKNAVVRAAYSAAQHGSLITTQHLAEAAGIEAAATGRLYRDVTVG